MKLFEATDAPRVFALPPGVKFAECFADGLRSRLAGGGPEELAKVQVAVNTRRTARALNVAFETAAPGVFLPKIDAIDSLGAALADAPPKIGRLKRVLALSRMITAFLAARPNLDAPSPSNATALASSLAGLLDECQRERIAPHKLAEACADERHAAHWAEFSSFFAHAAKTWPEILNHDFQAADPEARNALEVDALLRAWGAAPPQTPIIAAGSTGSRRLTSDTLEAIAHLPQGAVVLPGFDFAMEPDDWRQTKPDHPQHRFRALLHRLGVTPDQVEPWLDGLRSSPVKERGVFLSQALRPAPVTHHWRKARETLAPQIMAATADIEVIEAPTPRWEAEAIAFAMRAELASETASVALVTPDRALGRRVAAALARWGVVPDDSSGRPLALTPTGSFLEITANALSQAFDPISLLAALKHPLCAAGEGRKAHADAVDRLEVKGLRSRDIAITLTDTDALLTAIARDEEPVASEILRPYLDALRGWSAPATLSAHIKAHLQVAEALAGAELWEKAAGRDARRAMADFEDAAEVVGEIAPADYPAYLRLALAEAGDVREEAFVPDQRLKILGPLEARAQSADLMILAGLNEGVWPGAPPIDPWLSRPMREDLGLPSPEQRIGLSAHDFQQAAAAPRVLLTRALRDGEAPTREARWLTRFRTLLNGVAPTGERAWETMRENGARHLTGAQALDAHTGEAKGAARPAPKPPVAARPRKISVTDVEKLIRDPYEVYAKRVLGLYPLQGLGAAPDARMRGEVLHQVMEEFTRITLMRLPDDAEAVFDRVVDTVLNAAHIPAAQALIWRARLTRVKPWFLRTEETRRAYGDPVGVELDAEANIETIVGPVKLTGRADRIDQLHDGSLAIYDYKAGKAPSQKQVDIFAKQLPLLGAMAAVGAFEEAPTAWASQLAYLTLSGAGEGGKPVEIEPDEEALENLASLLNAYFDESVPYLPRAYVERSLTYAGEYEHLSRYGEWTDVATDSAPPTVTS